MRNYVAGVLTAGILLGALRWADLALWTDLDTGLVTAGPVWARYLALALVAGLALLAGELPGASAAAVERPRTRGAALALSLPVFVAGALYLIQGGLDLLGGTGPAGAVHGALGVLCALWLECLGQRWLLAGLRSQRRSASAPPPAWLGVLGSLVFAWDVLASFMTNGSSWHRTIPTSAVWQQLAALLLLGALLRAVCLPDAPNPKNLCRCGLLAWVLCLAWQLPRCVLLPAGPGDWGLAALGLLGGACALFCAQPGPLRRGNHAAG